MNDIKNGIVLDKQATDYLKENIGGGGSSDNTFVVTLTGNNDELTQDKTNEEIYQALKEGKICNALYIYTYSEGGIELESYIYSQQITQAQKNYGIEEYTYDFKFSQEMTGNYIVFNDTIQKFKLQGIM